MKQFARPEVAAVFDTYPKAVKAKLLRLRRLIFETAARMPEVGPLEETLKWGQPSYLTTRSGSGSTIRIDRIKPKAGRNATQYAMYFHCQTTLVDTFKEMYRADFKFEANRAIVFGQDDEIPVEALRHCISLALTYHSGKKRRRPR